MHEHCECCGAEHAARPRRRLGRALLVVSLLASGLVGAWSAVAIGQGEPELVVEADATLLDKVNVNAKIGDRSVASHGFLPPGTTTGWHYTPGPHVVIVREGSLDVYDLDCNVRHFEEGDSWFDPAHKPFIHEGVNPSEDGTTELIFVDFRKPGEELFIFPEDTPPSCAS